MDLPIKYKLENGYLWYQSGASQTWKKGFYTYGGTKISILNQGFGSLPEVYKQFGLLGHNGFDLYAPDGCCLFAPVDGKISEVVIDDVYGYGHYFRMVGNDGGNFELTFGHLKDVFIKKDQQVTRGSLLALCDNTGFSTGSHLHFGKRLLDKDLKVVNYNNGYFGSIDFSNELNFQVEEKKDLEKLFNYASEKGSPFGYYFGWGGSDRLKEACLKLGINGRITQSQYYQYILFY